MTQHIDASGQIFNCPVTLNGPVTINGDVTYADPPPGVSLDDLVNLTGSGTATFADLHATDDLVVDDDASIGGDLAVTGAATVGGTLGITGATTAAAISCTTLAASSNASVGGTLGVTGATTCAALTASGTVTTNGTLDVNGPLDLAGATITMPANQQVVLRYVSQSITQAALTAGASCTVALTGEPTGWIPLAGYVVTSVTTTSGSADTDGLTCRVGPPNGYLSDVDVFGAAGRKESPKGTSMGTYRANDSLVATFTASGNDPDCADITALALKVVIVYLTVSAE